MRNWTPEKRNQVILLSIVTLAVMAGIYLILINQLTGALRNSEMKLEVARRNLELTQRGLAMATQAQADIERNQQTLDAFEGTMPEGDRYLWMINHTLEMLDRHGLGNINYEQPQNAVVDTPPSVPYAASSYGLSGSASYHRLGSFICEFENQFPFARLTSLQMQAASPGLGSADKHQLSFRIGFTSLTRPTPAQ